MPDPNSPNVPRLRARVHQRLSSDECGRIPLGALRYRPLRAEDFEEMVALHTEWFPVSYDEAFYTKSVQGEIFTLVATHSRDKSGDEDLLGMITMSTACEHHCDDITTVLGADWATTCRQPDPEGEAGSSHGSLAYILTLGVADNFRRRGLARELLRRAVAHVGTAMPHVQAVYLHVVTYNEAAIQLYEGMHFMRIDTFKSFYHLHGQPYDSFLYAYYVNGGRPPWKWRLRNLASSWRDWVLGAWSSLWRGPGRPPSADSDAEQPLA